MAKVKDAEKAPETEAAEAADEAVRETVKAEEPAKTEPAKATRAAKKESEKDAFFVYIGPTIHGVIQTGGVYPGSREDAEKALETAITKYPRIARLLVSDRTIAADRIEVKKPGTRLSTEYARLAAEVKK